MPVIGQIALRILRPQSRFARPTINGMRIASPVNLAFTAAILTLLSTSAAGGGRVAATLLALHLQSSPAVVGFLLAAYSVLPALLAIWIGRFIDRAGAKSPIMIGLGVITAGLVLPLLWPSLPVLFAAMLLMGCGTSILGITLSNAVGVASRAEDRARNFTIYTSGLSASNAIGPLLVGFAIDGFGFQGAFVLLLGFAAAALGLFWIRRAAFPAPRPKVAPQKGAALGLLLDPKLRPMFIASTSVAAIWDTFQFLAPVWGTQAGLSASSIGMVMGAFALATFTVRATLPMLSGRFREWTLITASIGIAGLGLASFPLATSFGPLVIASIVAGLGFGFGFPMVLSVAFATSPKGREAEVSGLRYTLSAGVHMGVPIAMGAASGVFGVAVVALGAAAFMFGGAWNAWGQARPRDLK